MSKRPRTLSLGFCAAVAKLHAAGQNNRAIIKRFCPPYKDKDIPIALEQARRAGLLTTPQMNRSACREHGLSDEQIDATILGGQLANALRMRSTSLRSVRIFYPPRLRKISKPDLDLPEFAPFAAVNVLELVEHANCRTIGVSWGLTPRMTIDAMRALPQPNASDKPRLVFPTCGLPLAQYAGNRTAADNASEFHLVLNGENEPFRYSLPLMPALIPNGAEQQFFNLLDRYCPGYMEVFGSGPIGQRAGGLIDRADLILTSVSAGNALGSLLASDATEWAGFGNFEQLRRRTQGDIGGVLVRRSSDPDDQLDQFDRHWTGLTRATIERTVRRAIRKDGAGVCVVAIAPNKADVVLACLLAPHRSTHDAGVETGLISHLICDYPLAVRLKALAERRGIVFDPPA